MSRRVVLIAVTVPISLSLLGRRLALLADGGWSVHVAVGEPVPPELQPDARVTVHIVPMSREIAPMTDARSLAAWIALIRQLRPTVVVGATPKAAFIAMVAARMMRVPHRILEAWGARWDGASGARVELVRRADQLAVSSATQTIAVSDSLADLMIAGGVAKQRPIVLGFGGTQGVDVEVFHPASASPEPACVGFVGRLAADKGIEDLRQVMQLVHAEAPSVSLRIAGWRDEADPVDEQTSAWLLDDEQNQLVGQIKDVSTFLQGISVLCFPSHREGLPNAVIEAAACGIPVVAWDVTGVRDAVLDGITGYLVPIGAYQAMADRLIALLSNPAKRERMGAAARSFASTHFEAARVQRAFVEFLDQL